MRNKFKFYAVVQMILLALISEPGLSQDRVVVRSSEEAPDAATIISEALSVESSILLSLKIQDLKNLSGFSAYDKNMFSFDALDSLPLPKMTSELRCLAEAIYFEARGETLEGQYAVGEVIINRMISNSFPNSICGVVSEGSGRLNACQFSYNCDGKLEIIVEKKIYNRISKLSRILLEPSARVLTDGATFYHAKAVNPSWAKKFTKTYEIGQHIFYRPY